MISVTVDIIAIYPSMLLEAGLQALEKALENRIDKKASSVFMLYLY